MVPASGYVHGTGASCDALRPLWRRLPGPENDLEGRITARAAGGYLSAFESRTPARVRLHWAPS